MATFDPATPQLQAAQKWIDAYVTRDIGKIGATLSKNYKHQLLPKSMGLPEEGREEYIKKRGELLPSFTKFEVRIQRRGIALRLVGLHSFLPGDGPRCY